MGRETSPYLTAMKSYRVTYITGSATFSVWVDAYDEQDARERIVSQEKDLKEILSVKQVI